MVKASLKTSDTNGIQNGEPRLSRNVGVIAVSAADTIMPRLYPLLLSKQCTTLLGHRNRVRALDKCIIILSMSSPDNTITTPKSRGTVSSDIDDGRRVDPLITNFPITRRPILVSLSAAMQHSKWICKP